jgi:hypothetical protein
MPTKQQITTKVNGTIKDMTGLSPKPGNVLADAPLRMDSTSLANLALGLRNYVKGFDPEQTVTVTEVRKSGLTVEQLIDLIDKKLN